MYIYSDFFNNDIFHFKHIMILIVCFALIIVGTIFSVKKLKINTMHRILLIVGFVSESLKVFTYILMNESSLGGYLPKTDLPFHLCSLQLILILILNLSHNEKLKHLLHGFMLPTCLLGGILALFIATSSARNNWVITIQYFLFHSTISIFALYLIFRKDVVFTAKDYVNTLLLLIGVLFVAIYLNSILYYKKDDGTFADINFMYVVNPPMDGIPFLNKNGGWICYILKYIALCIVCLTLCYIRPIIVYFKSKKSKKQNQDIKEEAN